MGTSYRLFTSAMLLLATLASAAAPVIAAELAPAEAFASLPRLSGARLSPDGKYLAYLMPVEGRKNLAILDLTGKQKPVLVPPVKDLDFEWLHWANDDRIVFAMSFFGRRFAFYETVETRLLSIRKDGSGLAALVQAETGDKTGTRIAATKAAPQLQDNIIDWLPDDPRHVLLSLDADLDGRDEVRRLDVNNGDYDIVTDGMTGIQEWLTDQTGQLRYGRGYRGRTDIRSFALRDSDGEWRREDMDQWPWGDFRPVAFTDNPDVVYAQGTAETGRTVIRKLDIARGEFTASVFEHDEFDAKRIVLDPVTRQPVGVAYIEHGERIVYFDETMQRLQRSMDKALPDTSNRIVNMSTDRSRVLVLASSAVNPGTYYLWDRNRKSLDIVGEVRPGLTADLLSPVEPVSYEARDGTVIPGYLTVPRGAARENLPTVILPHGEPEKRDTGSYSYLPQFLASRGYAVLQPNYRGSGGYGHAYANAGRKQWGGLMQDDVTDGVRWLIAEGISDPDRICIAGWFYGGYVAAMGAAKTPDLFRCAASINGVLDLPRYINHLEDYIGGAYWTQRIGLAGQNPKTVSPFHLAESIGVPLLILQAKDNPNVSSDQGERMAKHLKRLGKPVKLVTVKQGGHDMSNEQARLTVLRSLEDFLGQYIGANAQPQQRASR